MSDIPADKRPMRSSFPEKCLREVSVKARSACKEARGLERESACRYVSGRFANAQPLFQMVLGL